MSEKKYLVDNDKRAPSPPLGYSCQCKFSREKQMHIVAMFHAHKIRPSRIAYRVGIDIAFIEALIAGEENATVFSNLVASYRKNRYKQQLDQAEKLVGGSRFERQRLIEQEYIEDSSL